MARKESCKLAKEKLSKAIKKHGNTKIMKRAAQIIEDSCAEEYQRLMKIRDDLPSLDEILSRRDDEPVFLDEIMPMPETARRYTGLKPISPKRHKR